MTDELFIRKMRDVASRSEYDTSVTPFLTPAEQCEAFDSLPEYRSKLFFWGAFRGASAEALSFSPIGLPTLMKQEEACFRPSANRFFFRSANRAGSFPRNM